MLPFVPDNHHGFFHKLVVAISAAKDEVKLSTQQFVQKFDVVPQFWQFLKGLSPDDLIIELIQNELDANATRTQIVFHPDRLVCRGDGELVAEDGWRRLSYVMGAGDQVESKRFRIGVKNHGLKGVLWSWRQYHSPLRRSQNCPDSLQRRTSRRTITGHFPKACDG